ncbi:MAG TPA: DUF1499 domain-containing protein [Steroidobacteraceae bacterium]|nr:DUF1499 domain-containing protein [Steroidobacteraceae bacterium]
MSSTPFPSLGPPAWPLRLARAGSWLIGAGIALGLASGPAYRVGLTSLRAALLALAVAALLVFGATALALFGFSVASVRRIRFNRAASALTVAAGVLASAYLIGWVVRGRTAPPIHDVSTDLADPPAFVAVVALRGAAHAVNPPAYAPIERLRGGRIVEVADLQRAYYPDIRPLELALDPAAVLQAAERAAQRLGWRIDAYVPAEGRLEATDCTLFFGFRDDIVVRVRSSGHGARLDVRSESRVGLGDAGTNARRVRAFLGLVGRMSGTR